MIVFWTLAFLFVKPKSCLLLLTWGYSRMVYIGLTMPIGCALWHCLQWLAVLLQDSNVKSKYSKFFYLLFANCFNISKSSHVSSIQGSLRKLGISESLHLILESILNKVKGVISSNWNHIKAVKFCYMWREHTTAIFYVKEG